MKGVLQNKPHNCVQACVASIFELPLSEVPEFDPERWGEELEGWLGRIGLSIVNLRFGDDIPQDVPRGITLGAIASRSGRFPPGWKHSVVCRDGRVVWDPLIGDQDGTERAEEYTLIYPLDPGGRT